MKGQLPLETFEASVIAEDSTQAMNKLNEIVDKGYTVDFESFISIQEE